MRTATLLAAALAAALALPAAGTAAKPSGPAPSEAVPLPEFSLRAVDPCFHAPSAIGRVWPLAPQHRPHAIRGGFNDLRGGDFRRIGHYGVDIEARAGDPVLAPTDGVTSIRLAGLNSSVRFRAARISLVHVDPAQPRLFSKGGTVGTVNYLAHVHFSESTPACGWVDPRRPTGPLFDPANTQPPRIGRLYAVRHEAPRRFRGPEATARQEAEAPLPDDAAAPPDEVPPDEAPPGDEPAEPEAPQRGDAIEAGPGQWILKGERVMPLDRLRGVVEFRAPVSDKPRRETTLVPQQPLMPAAVRSWLAPLDDRRTALGGPNLVFNGAGLLSRGEYHRVMAPGTKRVNHCLYYPDRPCVSRLIFRVSPRGGFDTRRIPDGRYRWCVQALTINGRSETLCTRIRIDNRPDGA